MINQNNMIDGETLGKEILQALKEMNAGLGRVVHSPAIEARKMSGLSQSQFAKMMGVSVRTLQEWEQGRRSPSGAAQTLLKVVKAHPEWIREVMTA